MTEKGRRQKDREKESKHKKPVEERQAERIEGEVMPRTYGQGQLPHDIKDMIDNTIYDFMTYECKPPIEDMRKAPAPVWGACCMYIGQEVFKKRGILNDREKESHHGGTAYDYNLLDACVDIWAYYCHINAKAPFIYHWCCFCGLSVDFFGDGQNVYSDDVTPIRKQIFKKLHAISESSLAALISDGRINPTGALAILNHHYGWASTSIVLHQSSKQALTAADLPKLSINQ